MLPLGCTPDARVAYPLGGIGLFFLRNSGVG